MPRWREYKPKKIAVNVSVHAKTVTTIEDISRMEKRLFSHVFSEVLNLGLTQYQEILSKRQFSKDLEVVKEAERIEAARYGKDHEKERSFGFFKRGGAKSVENDENGP